MQQPDGLIKAAMPLTAILGSMPSSRSSKVVHRLQYVAEEFVCVICVDPAHHQYHVALRLHPGERTARANGKVTRRGHARKNAVRMVEPDQVSIERRDCARRAHALDPVC